jgi:hypothetical protein
MGGAPAVVAGAPWIRSCAARYGVAAGEDVGSLVAGTLV